MPLGAKKMVLVRELLGDAQPEMFQVPRVPFYQLLPNDLEDLSTPPPKETN